jgi:hypothetical protein
MTETDGIAAALGPLRRPESGISAFTIYGIPAGQRMIVQALQAK